MTKATNQVETLNSGAEAIMCIFFPKVTQSVAFFPFCPADNSRQRLYSTGRQRTRTERSLVHALRLKRWSDNNDGEKKGRNSTKGPD